MLINIKIGKLMITERTILKTVYTLSGVYLTKAGIGGFMDNKRIESDNKRIETENKRIETEKEVAFKRIDADKEVALKKIEADLLCHQSK
jgi:hypothetical protein